MMGKRGGGAAGQRGRASPWGEASLAPTGLLGALLLVFTTAASPALAQSDPRLVEAVRTAQEGRSDSARAAVQRLLAVTPPTDTLYPEVLYTQAMVAGEAAEMRRSLQRVVVEHGASSWADDALLRLVQMDYATRTLDPAARNLEKLRQDYPLSPLLPQASYWAARIYFDLNNPAQACRWLAEGVGRTQGNLELQNQLMYLNQRCSGVAGQAGSGDTAGGQTGGRADGQRDTAQAIRPAAEVPDSAAVAEKPGARPDSVPRRPPAPRARFRVQVSAVATPGAADDVATRIERLGYTTVIVRERGLYKVRAGTFSTRQEAQAAVTKLKARLGGAPFVVAEP